MPDETWTLAGISAIVTDPSRAHPAVSPGTEREWTFLFEDDDAFTVGTSAVGSASIGTGYQTRHSDVLDIAESANRAVVAFETDTNGAVTYHETVVDAPVDTFVSLLAPQGDIGRPARWVLVVGGADTSPSEVEFRQARVRLVDLAPASAYATVSALQSDLEEDTI